MKIGKLQKGLVGHWSLDKASYKPSTQRFTDKSAYCNHGTSANAAVFGADRMGQADRAMTFNGLDDYIDSNTVPPVSAGTMLLWFNGTQSEKMLMGSQDPLRCYLGNYYGLLGGGIGSDNWIVIRGARIPSGWNLGLISWDGTTIKLSLNNVECYSGTQNGLPSAINIYVGGHNNRGSPSLLSDTSISEAWIYNRVLTAAERTLLFESYRPKVMI